jgi:hypothetical protein
LYWPSSRHAADFATPDRSDLKRARTSSTLQNNPLPKIEVKFPIETSRRNRRVRQPVECEVIEYIVSCQVTCGVSINRAPEYCRSDRCRRLAITVTTSSGTFSKAYIFIGRVALAQTGGACLAVNNIGVQLNNPFTADWVIDSVFTSRDGRKQPMEMDEPIARDSAGKLRFEKDGFRPIPNHEEERTAHSGLPVGTGPANETSNPHIVIIDCPNGKNISIQPRLRTARIAQQLPAPVSNSHHQSILSKGFPPPSDPRYVAEDLGYKEIQGFRARGVRVTEIGTEQDGEWNGKPILVTEEWGSEDIGATLISIRSDLRKDSTYTEKMINIKREEPDPSLFEIPADYKIETMPDIHSKPTGPAH